MFTFPKFDVANIVEGQRRMTHHSSLRIVKTIPLVGRNHVFAFAFYIVRRYTARM